MLFENDDSDCEVDIKTNNDYAKNYDNWRQKEELNRLKTKYGDNVEDLREDSSSSSEDDEDCVELTEKLEKDFFKTLSSLKNKDPKIYDDKVSFFDNVPIDPSVKKRKKKEEPMFLKDYERKLLLEKGGHISDSEDETPRSRSPTYVEEQHILKKDLKEALTNVEEGDEDEEWGGLFKAREKTNEEKEKEEADYKLWLMGQKKSLQDKDTAKELKPLKDYWNDPNLDDGEKFLRDYILNKKFLDKEDDDRIPAYDEIVHDSDEGLSEDEQAVDKQEEFEHKYNYRFEEPDQDFIKRYPRTMENSVRRTDDRRKVKRAEIKERKQKEKQEKMDDLKKLQKLKKVEIEDKLKKLREITGNTEVAFEDQDIDDDFDPEAHDRRMQALFDDGFYQGEEGDQKPEFPELDEELEIERWDKYVPTEDDEKEDVAVPHCEDDDFIMDCDYDPAAVQKELIENSKGKKKRKRQSKFAKAVSVPKPEFNPNDKTYEEYLDEYYKLDCEDIIGDIPCRFKYRKVVPNSFGLTIEEILTANDRELNRWCSLKKALQHRPDHVEKYDQIAFSKKAQNEGLKKKLIPSLFVDETPENNETTNKSGEKNNKQDKKGTGNLKVKNNQVSKNMKNQEKDNDEIKVINKKQKNNIQVNDVKKSKDVKNKVTSNNKSLKLKPQNENQITTLNSKNEDEIINNQSVELKLHKDTPVEESKEKSKNVQAKIQKNVMTKENTPKKSRKRKRSETIKNESNTPDEGSERKRKLSASKEDKAHNVSKTNPKMMKNKNTRKSTKNSEIRQGTNKGAKSQYQFNRNKRSSMAKRKQNKSKNAGENKTDLGISDARLQAFGFKPKKFKNKMKYGKKNNK